MDAYTCRFGSFHLITGEDSPDVSSCLARPASLSEAFALEALPRGRYPFDNPLGRRAFILGRNVREVPLILFEIRELPLFIAGKPSSATQVRLSRLPDAPGKNIGVIEHGFIALSAFAAKLGYPQNFFACLDASDRISGKLLAAGLPRLPKYKTAGDMISTLYNTALGRDGSRPLPKGYEITKAHAPELRRITALLTARGQAWNYAPVLDEARLQGLLSSGQGLALSDILTLHHQDQIAGAVAVWDQRPYRRFTANRYPDSVNALLGVRNFFSGITGGPKLPRPGETLDMVRLSFFSIHQKHFHMAKHLLQRALHAAGEKNASLAVLSLAETNSLRRHIPLPGHSVRHRVYSVTFESIGSPARGANFTPQPEMALL